MFVRISQVPGIGKYSKPQFGYFSQYFIIYIFERCMQKLSYHPDTLYGKAIIARLEPFLEAI